MKRIPCFVAVILFLSALFGFGCTLSVCARSEYIVTRADDVAGGVCAPGSCALRQAVQASNMCAGEQTIRIPSGTYTLTLSGFGENDNVIGDLDIRDDVRIIGEGMPVIDGNASDRVFDIQADTVVEMSGLVIQNGFGGDGIGTVDGGGLTNAGDLTATGLLIWHNVGRPMGTYTAGGLANTFTGNAHISHSAIILNASGEGAGGLSNYGNMVLDNVTISGNTGFGIFSSGPLDISYSTIANNMFAPPLAGTAGYFSFQIHNAVLPVVIRNSIISGYPDAGGCWGEGYVSEGFNIEYTSPDTHSLDSCNFTQPSDLVGVDPLLLTLGSSGIHALDSVSPALDTADPARCSGTDQRGVARPQGSGCDRGAYERDAPLTAMITVEPVIPPLDSGPTLTPPPMIVPSVVIPNEVPCLPCILMIQVPANCRQGPGLAYPVVNSVLPGEQVQVLGKDADGTWWYSQLKNDKCWISNVAGTPQGDVNLLQVISAPPPPAPTATEQSAPAPKPTDPPTVTDPDNDGDGYPFSNDCDDKNPKINPGAAETPGDKVDSNCNGDDDK